VTEDAAPLRVLIADDHPAFRAGLRAVLAAAPELELVGEAGNGAEALAMAGELRPDVVVMDVQMPGPDGIATTRQLVAAVPGTRVLVLTMFDDDATVFRALQAGARGYVTKGASFPELTRAIHAVGHGEALFGPGVAERLAQWFAAAPPPLEAEAFPQLSAREREVLVQLALGRKNAEIAAELFLSAKTVRNLVSSILAKLQVADRAQAGLRARGAGLGG
jgi:DNA-binding NarL/FixJ family response regulator